MKRLMFLTLVNGTHVIGNVTENDEAGFYEVEMPMQFLPIRDQSARVIRATLEPFGHVGFFAPFEVATIRYEHVVLPRADIPDNLRKQYADATGAIQIATKEETSSIVLASS